MIPTAESRQSGRVDHRVTRLIVHSLVVRRSIDRSIDQGTDEATCAPFAAAESRIRSRGKGKRALRRSRCTRGRVSADSLLSHYRCCVPRVRFRITQWEKFTLADRVSLRRQGLYASPLINAKVRAWIIIYFKKMIRVMTRWILRCKVLVLNPCSSRTSHCGDQFNTVVITRLFVSGNNFFRSMRTDIYIIIYYFLLLLIITHCNLWLHVQITCAENNTAI